MVQLTTLKLSLMKCDLLLKNGVVIDGTGNPRYRADVAISNGKISAVGPNLQVEASTTVDVDGQTISPGFIDVHTHDDRLVLADPSRQPKGRQGATTVVLPEISRASSSPGS